MRLVFSDFQWPHSEKESSSQVLNTFEIGYIPEDVIMLCERFVNLSLRRVLNDDTHILVHQ